MKIRHLDGKVTDTEKISNDIHAHAMEKTYEYLAEMSKYKIPFMLRISPSKDNFTGAHNFSSDHSPEAENAMHLILDTVQYLETYLPNHKIVLMKKEEFEQIQSESESPE